MTEAQSTDTLLEGMMELLNKYVQVPSGSEKQKRSVVVRGMFVRMTAAHHVCAAMLGYVEALCRLVGMSQAHIRAGRQAGMAKGMQIVVRNGRQTLHHTIERLAPVLELLKRLEADNEVRGKKEAGAAAQGGEGTASSGSCLPDRGSNGDDPAGQAGEAT